MILIVKLAPLPVKMRTMGRELIIGLIAAARLAPQTLEVHSEFLRVNPRGEFLTIDTTPKPREKTRR